MKSIRLQQTRFSYSNKTFKFSENDIPFDTSYQLVNQDTKRLMVFKFVESTGPEFDVDTKWIYASEEGFMMEVSNHPVRNEWKNC